MKTLLAPDSFKGCLTAAEAAGAAASALTCGEVVRLPLSDGGEGFTECMVQSLGGVFAEASVHDPLMRPIRARYGLVHDGRTAVIETAAASGLTLLRQQELDPLRTSSFGTGELMKDAVQKGVEEIWIGLGGTATMDCGVGLLEALGSLPRPVRIQGFYDVDVPLLQAPALFGPQKGADADGVRELERRFRVQAEAWKADYGIDAEHLPGAGAAGGIGAALSRCLGAQMRGGIGAVLEAVRFREKVAGCDLVITGEGKADRGTLTGKVPSGVLEATRRYAPGVPVVLLAGQVEDREALLEAGFDEVIQITTMDQLGINPMDKSFALGNLRRCVQHLPYFRD